MQRLQSRKGLSGLRAIVRASGRRVGRKSGKGWHETKLEKQTGARSCRTSKATASATLRAMRSHQKTDTIQCVFRMIPQASV